MTDTVLLLLLLAVTLVLLATQWVRIEVTSLGIVAALALTGLLPPEEALSGFPQGFTAFGSSDFFQPCEMFRDFSSQMWIVRSKVIRHHVEKCRTKGFY